MKTPVILLLTKDNELENLVAQAFSEIGGVSHVRRNPDGALEAVCGVQDLDVVLIDVDQEPHMITLLNAVKMCREDLPAIAIMRDDDKHLKALAYANGAVACLPKAISAVRLATVICKLRRLRPEPVAA